MIILKLNEGVCEKKQKLWRKSKAKEEIFEYTRAGVIINNRAHFVISVNESNLCDESFKKMLMRYKGEIITSEKLQKYEFLTELLFDEKPYLKRAVFQNFKNIFSFEQAKTLNILVKDFNFDLKDELPLLLPKVKTLTVKIKDNLYTSDWQKKCFLEYGIKPKVVTDENSEVLSFDVVADFDNIKNKTLLVEFLGKTRTIYPDCEYLKISDELKFLRNFELEDSTICAVFGQNNSLLTDSNVYDKMIKN